MERELEGWLEAMSARGADVMAVVDGGGGMLPPQFTGMTTASLQANFISPNEWDTLTAGQVRKTTFAERRPGPVLSFFSWQPDPGRQPNFVFRTSQGAMGIGQITEIQKEPEKQLRVRYKLLKNAVGATPVHTPSNATPSVRDAATPE